MKTSSVVTLFACLTLGLLLLGTAGCATSGYHANERTASTMTALAGRVEAAGLQMDTAVTELNNLVNNPQSDLRPQFDRFAAAVSKLNSLSNSITKADESLEARGKLHLDNWEKSLASIQNDAIRASAETRKTELQARFDSLRAQCQKVQTSFTPVRADLNDLKRFLNTDLTPASLSNIRNTANRITDEATPARQSLSNLVAELRALGSALSPHALPDTANLK